MNWKKRQIQKNLVVLPLAWLSIWGVVLFKSTQEVEMTELVGYLLLYLFLSWVVFLLFLRYNDKPLKQRKGLLFLCAGIYLLPLVLAIAKNF